MKRSKDWLILNAVVAWLHNYPNNTDTEDYKELKNELTNAAKDLKGGSTTKTQRKKKTPSDSSSKEEN
tara:strand:+ start:316 stop:519 length:204 start_codon:yes stop_codon:yes gene_type:complete